jgi:hypothetical protein
MLLKRGLDPNTPSKDGSTALHYVSTLQYGEDIHEIIGMLLEAHADQEMQRLDGSFPIHVIFASASLPGPGPPSSSRVLDVKNSALATLSKDFVGRQTNNGDTALYLACKHIVAFNEPPSWIALLLEQGYDPMAENDDGQSSLEILLVGFESKRSGMGLNGPRSCPS